jgi:hypothetical protein
MVSVAIAMTISSQVGPKNHAGRGFMHARVRARTKERQNALAYGIRAKGMPIGTPMRDDHEAVQVPGGTGLAHLLPSSLFQVAHAKSRVQER